eukprot:5351414-Pyramimonas_sp.AAC.1
MQSFQQLLGTLLVREGIPTEHRVVCRAIFFFRLWMAPSMNASRASPAPGIGMPLCFVRATDGPLLPH